MGRAVAGVAAHFASRSRSSACSLQQVVAEERLRGFGDERGSWGVADLRRDDAGWRLVLGRQDAGAARRRPHATQRRAGSRGGSAGRRRIACAQRVRDLRRHERKRPLLLGEWSGALELGDASFTDRLTPVAVTGLEADVVSISTAYRHTCAVTTTGSVPCWGDNSLGQLGDGSVVRSGVPLPVVGFEAAPAQVPALGAPGLLLLTVSLLAIGGPSSSCAERTAAEERHVLLPPASAGRSRI